MVQTLAVMLRNINDTISAISFGVFVLFIICIILWVYVVKNKRLLTKLDKNLNKKLNKINYIVADISENAKNDNKELGSSQKDKEMKKLIEKYYKP